MTPRQPERRSVRRYPMILGRSPALWVALLAAAINVIVVVFGIPLTVDQVLSLNAFGLALIGILANESDPSTVPTFAATLQDRRGQMTAAAISARLNRLRPPSGRRAADQAPDPDPLRPPD